MNIVFPPGTMGSSRAGAEGRGAGEGARAAAERSLRPQLRRPRSRYRAVSR